MDETNSLRPQRSSQIHVNHHLRPSKSTCDKMPREPTTTDIFLTNPTPKKYPKSLALSNSPYSTNPLNITPFAKYSQQTEGPYSTNLPSPDDICRLLELECVMVDRTIKSQTVTLTPNQILTKELSPDMKQWEELIRVNMFGLEGHWDHLPSSLSHMLYCVVAKEQYNLAYFFVKRIECAMANPTINLSYGMFLIRLYRHIMEAYPHLDKGIYDIVDRVMRPLALKQTQRPRSDHGKARHSVSSSSSHHHGMSSHQHDDDDYDDVKTSVASTPSLQLS
ncbi:hypothetical protein Tco_0851793 [Tanacetum coccineum]